MSDSIVDIFASATHGRGIRTKRDVKPGELLLRDKPFSYILYHGGSISNNQSTTHCDHCLTEKGSKLLRCSGCKYARYCDKTCQRAAWPDHKDECHSITRANASQDSPIFQDQIRLMARTHWKRTKLVENASIDANGFPNIPDLLVKHVDRWGQVRQRDFDKGFLQLAQFIMMGVRVEDMKDLFSILQANCVEISDAELHNIGYGLYLKTAFFNHACDFNCVATFNSTTLEVRATKEIKKGEECFISYIELYNPTEDRHNETNDLWYFTCSCAYCEDKDRDARISALKCGNNDCPAAVPFHYMRTDPSYKVKCPSCNWSEKGKKLLDKTWPTVKKMRKNKRMIDNWRKNPECDILYFLSKVAHEYARKTVT
ncbi:histone-lysine N-methyltransferase SMYD3-like [Amphiura filiformis]|uniref:histone-lysine N-methyltransferase SMYD3-like n=1 Tax=Amphiura filiformis TaxID=82378 RepID=UPI003B218ACC